MSVKWSGSGHRKHMVVKNCSETFSVSIRKKNAKVCEVTGVPELPYDVQTCSMPSIELTCKYGKVASWGCLRSQKVKIDFFDNFAQCCPVNIERIPHRKLDRYRTEIEHSCVKEAPETLFSNIPLPLSMIFKNRSDNLGFKFVKKIY